MGARIMNGRLWTAVLLVSGFGSVSCVKVTSFIPQGGKRVLRSRFSEAVFSTEPTGNKVTFGELEGEVTFASEETLRVRVPEGAVRAKIRVSRGWLRRDESETDYIPLPDYIRYKKFESPTLGIRQGYWIMYPPSFVRYWKRSWPGSRGSRIERIFPSRPTAMRIMFQNSGGRVSAPC